MNEENETSGEKLWTAEFIGLSATNFFHFMAQYVLIAGLPICIMNEMKGGELEAGLAMTFFQIGTVACRPFAGRLIDRLHKGRLLFGATLAFFILMLAFCFAHTEEELYALRLLHGIEFAVGTTAAATLAALVLPASKRGTGIGYFALSTNLAMVVGPLVGLLLVHSFGTLAMFVFLTISALFTLWIANRRKLPQKIVLPAEKEAGKSRFALVERQALPASLLGGLVFFAYGGLLTFIPLYAHSLGLEGSVSAFFAVFALVILATRPFIGSIFDKKGADYTVYPGFLLFFVGFLCFAAARTPVAFFFAAAVLGAGFGALSPAFQTLAVASVAPERAGLATATYFWSLDISVGLAAATLGLFAANFGYATLYGILCPAVIVIALLAYTRLSKGTVKKKKTA